MLVESESKRAALRGYTAAMVLILVVLVLAAVGVHRLARTLEPRQRVVLVAVFLLGVAFLVVKSMQLVLLGLRTAE